MVSGRRAAPLPVSFFRRDAATVARELLGAVIVSGAGRGRTVGRIVEVEAYLGAEDPASHAYRYRRHRQNEALYGPAGSWYIYLSYGVHWCANLVAAPKGQGAAVLIRAVEPLEGITLMRRRRRTRDERALCAGPGRLTQAMQLTRPLLDGMQMQRSAALVLAGVSLEDHQVSTTVRIGISRAIDWPLRFVVRDSSWVSRPSTR